MKNRKKINQSYNTLLVIGLILLSVSLIWKRHEMKKLSFAPTTTYAQQLSEVAQQPATVEIPSLKIKLSVGSTVIHNGIWTVNENGASYLVASSVPGKSGNVIIYAHNTEDRFGRLANIKKNDIISITTRNGKKYIYKVVKKTVVSPNAVEVLEPEHEQELTVYTCYGFADFQRLVVKAIPEGI